MVAVPALSWADMHWVHKGNTLHTQAKGKTHKGAEEKMTISDLLSICKPKEKVGQRSASCSSHCHLPLLLGWPV